MNYQLTRYTNNAKHALIKYSLNPLSMCCQRFTSLHLENGQLKQTSLTFTLNFLLENFSLSKPQLS